MIKKRCNKFQLYYFLPFSVIKTLGPDSDPDPKSDPYPDPDSFEMQDPDPCPDPDLMNPDSQHCVAQNRFQVIGEKRATKIMGRHHSETDVLKPKIGLISLFTISYLNVQLHHKIHYSIRTGLTSIKIPCSPFTLKQNKATCEQLKKCHIMFKLILHHVS